MWFALPPVQSTPLKRWHHSNRCSRLSTTHGWAKSESEKVRAVNVVSVFHEWRFSLWLYVPQPIKHIMICRAGFLLSVSNKYAYEKCQVCTWSWTIFFNFIFSFHRRALFSLPLLLVAVFSLQPERGCRELLIRFFRWWCHRRILDLRVNECICFVVHNFVLCVRILTFTKCHIERMKAQSQLLSMRCKWLLCQRNKTNPGKCWICVTRLVNWIACTGSHSQRIEHVPCNQWLMHEVVYVGKTFKHQTRIHTSRLNIWIITITTSTLS